MRTLFLAIFSILFVTNLSASARGDYENLTGVAVVKALEESGIRKLVIGCGRAPYAWQEQASSTNAWRELKDTPDEGNHTHEDAFRMAEDPAVRPEILFDITQVIPVEWHGLFAYIYLEKLPIAVLENPVTWQNCFNLLSDGGELHCDLSRSITVYKAPGDERDAFLQEGKPFSWGANARFLEDDEAIVKAIMATPQLEEYHKYGADRLLELFETFTPDQKAPMAFAALHQYADHLLSGQFHSAVADMLTGHGFEKAAVYRVGGEHGANPNNGRMCVDELMRATKPIAVVSEPAPGVVVETTSDQGEGDKDADEKKQSKSQKRTGKKGFGGFRSGFLL